jgi:glycosyltransferase
MIGWCLDTFDQATSGPDAPAVDNPFVETLRPLAEKYDIPLDRETLFGEFSVNPMPPAINLPVNTRMIPVRWLSHTRQGRLPGWLYPVPDRPRVGLSLGVSVRSYLKADWSYVKVLFDALSEMDVDVVATLNETQLEKVTTIPDNIRVVDYLPLDQLMPTLSALIHHGGLATMIAAGSARVPQLIVDFLDREIVAEAAGDGTTAVPRYALAPTTSAYVNGHGAGEVLDMSKPSVEGIRQQVKRILTEQSFTAGAGRLQTDLLASPSPADIVPVLEKLAGIQ